jgi:membrane associated rhomboid family serine protease
MTEFRPSRFEILPTVVKNLLIINGLFFLAQQSIKAPLTSFSFDNVLALHAWQSSLFRPWQLITHMFLHGDFWHIFGNMFAVWMFGSVLENLWGPKRFLTFYIICGLGAALIHLLFLSYEMIPLMNDFSVLVQEHASGNGMANSINRFNLHHPGAFNSNIDLANYVIGNPKDTQASNQLMETISNYYEANLNTATIGASGAVFGLLAAFVYLFPNTYIYLYFLVPVKAKWMGLGYFAYELFFALRNSAGDNVARWAHVGGAIVGLLIVMTWNKKNRKTFY